MYFYYDLTLATNIPHGSDILNKPCTVVLINVNGGDSPEFPCEIFAWPTQNTVRIRSRVMNIHHSWTGNGGTLTIAIAGNPGFAITGLVFVP